jgi:hypothetical protein
MTQPTILSYGIGLTREQLVACIQKPGRQWTNNELEIRFGDHYMTLFYTGFSSRIPNQRQGYFVSLKTEQQSINAKTAAQTPASRISVYGAGSKPFIIEPAYLLTAQEAIEIAWHFGTTGEAIANGSRRFEWGQGICKNPTSAMEIGVHYSEDGDEIDGDLGLIIEVIVEVLTQRLESDPDSAASQSIAQPIEPNTRLDGPGMTRQYWDDFISELKASPDFESWQLKLPPGQSFHAMTVKALAQFVKEI